MSYVVDMHVSFCIEVDFEALHQVSYPLNFLACRWDVSMFENEIFIYKMYCITDRVSI